MERTGEGPGAALRITLLTAPLLAFTLIMVWFSSHPIAPSPAVEASAANPAGLLTSNFVYDGLMNVENIGVSCLFLLILCLYFPRRVDVYMVYVLPVGAVVAGALGELTAISTQYLSLRVCGQACSFYGMSGMASAIVGFTFAAFFIVFSLTILQDSGRVSAGRFSSLSGRSSLRREVLLALAFVVYVILLLFISGLLALPGATTLGPGSSPSGPPPPPAILTQSPPVALVHAASLAYGFLLCFITFVLVSRRDRVFTVRTRR